MLNKTWKHQHVYCDSVGTSKLHNFPSYVDLKITVASPLPHFTAQLEVKHVLLWLTASGQSTNVPQWFPGVRGKEHNTAHLMQHLTSQYLPLLLLHVHSLTLCVTSSTQNPCLRLLSVNIHFEICSHFLCDLKLNAKDTSVMINLPLCARCDCSAVAPKATNRWMKTEEDDGCYGEDDGMAESEARGKKKIQTEASRKWGGAEPQLFEGETPPAST